MRVVQFVGDEGPALAGALAAEGISIDPRPLPQAPGPGAAAALAAGLRGGEEELGADPPDAVLVTDAGDVALGVTLTAVKLQIPTAWLRQAEWPTDWLIARVADVTLDAKAPAATLAEQLRDLAAPTIPAR